MDSLEDIRAKYILAKPGRSEEKPFEISIDWDSLIERENRKTVVCPTTGKRLDADTLIEVGSEGDVKFKSIKDTIGGGFV